MGLLEDKSWIAQNLYNEYLELKTEIPSINQSIDMSMRVGDIEVMGRQKIKLNEKVERFKFVLNQMKVEHKIKMEDLILLSVGIDV